MHSDAPVHNPEDDKFGRADFAERIAEIIKRRSDPASLVIGIYGVWGEGKTTLMNYVRHYLGGSSEVALLTFNPWRHSDENELLGRFFDQLADAVDASIESYRHKVGRVLTKVATVIPPISVSTPSGVGNSVSADVDIGRMIRDLGGALASSTLEEKKTKVSAALEDSGIRVVVMVDDLDRLDNEEVRNVFRLIKLTADFSNTVYIVACDPDIVAKALARTYGAEGGHDGLSFLDKIVQVPLRLPTVEPLTLTQYSLELIDQALTDQGVNLTEEQAREYRRAYDRGLRPVIASPRIANRYANAVSFSLPILRGEVHPVDLMLIEGLRVCYPRLYDHVRRAKTIFTGTGNYAWLFLDEKERKRRTEEFVTRALDAVPVEYREAAVDLLDALFPKTMAYQRGGSYAHTPSQWEAEQRVASDEYFDRYFGYAIPQHDIPDAAIHKIVNSAPSLSEADLQHSIRRLLARNPDTFLGKLWRASPDLPPDSAESLALALANLGSDLPNPPGVLGFTPFRRAASLVAALLHRIPQPSSRVRVMQRAVESADFNYALECLMECAPSARGNSAEDAPLAEDDVALLGRTLAVRSRTALEDPSRKPEVKALGTYLSVWCKFGEPEDVRGYVSDQLAQDPAFASRLINAFARRWVTSGGEVRLEFDSYSYDELAAIITPEEIAHALDATAHMQSDLEALAGADRLLQAFTQIHVARAEHNSPDSQERSNGGGSNAV